MIHNSILKRIQSCLQQVMIDDLDADDITRAGVIKIGDLQGNPDPDEARISVTLYVNDPDQFVTGMPTMMERRWWEDIVTEVEIGGATTHKRTFCIKARCLFDKTREDLETAWEITSTVRSRIENTLLRLCSLYGICYEDEYVSRGIVSGDFYGESIQAGGPPDSYDFQIKITFSVLTTKNNVAVTGVESCCV